MSKAMDEIRREAAGSRATYFRKRREHQKDLLARRDAALRGYYAQHLRAAQTRARADGDNVARALCSCSWCSEVRRLEAARRLWKRGKR